MIEYGPFGLPNGDNRSENADMSNKNPVKNTIACQWKVFCVQSIYAE